MSWLSGTTIGRKNPIICARQTILRAAFPALKWASDKNFPWQQEPRLQGNTPQWVYDFIEPGDIGLTVRIGEVTNILIGGKWKHVGVFGENGLVGEAVDPTTRIVTSQHFLETKDLACIVQPKLPLEIRLAAARTSLQMAGRKIPYDYDFLIGDIYSHTQAQYCAENPYLSYIINFPQWDFRPRKIWGVYTVLPDDYYLSTRHFDIKAIHDGKKWRNLWAENYRNPIRPI